MTALIRLFLILCALVDCSRCLEELNRMLIGESCKRDHECPEHAHCYCQIICRCDKQPRYLPSLDKSMCTATVGMECDADSVCRTMANAECRQGICACKDNFDLDFTNSSNCIGKPTKIGDRCQTHEACQDSFDVHALCINKKCQCLTAYHFTNETKTCIHNRGLYYSCEKDYQCYLDDKSPDILECKNDQCVCKEGEPQCARGSAVGTLTTILLPLSLLLQQMIR